MTALRALRTTPSTDELAAAVAPAMNGQAHDVIAETATAPSIHATPLGQGAVAAIMRAADESCDQIQGTVDMMVDLKAKLHTEAGTLSSHISQYTAMAAAIAGAFKDFKKEGERYVRGDQSD